MTEANSIRVAIVEDDRRIRETVAQLIDRADGRSGGMKCIGAWRTAEDALRDLIDNLVPPDQQLLIDAYCGAGFFARALLDKFEHVIGLDWDRFAIEAARENATAKESYIAGDLDLALGRLSPTISEFRREKTTLLVDPPTAGLSATVRKAIVDLAPATLIYVSCNPATLARDLKELQEKFRINSVTPLDMFPQTAEIEAAVQLVVGGQRRIAFLRRGAARLNGERSIGLGLEKDERGHHDLSSTGVRRT